VIYNDNVSSSETKIAVDDLILVLYFVCVCGVLC